ncbi:hypothetical protein Tco_0926720 [Tanacetum coccineum]|uniref:RNA-directed DNA polymerase, eukaryota n=1 Tax=Tanacetum coccineum TaxID=301880 RepID=A0ABQ5DDI3_9ASTR
MLSMPGHWRSCRTELTYIVYTFLIAPSCARGLKIIIAKRPSLGCRVSQNVVVQEANRIGCAVLNTPFRYLGVTVGEYMSRKSAWVGLVNKLQARLSKWKVKTLSIGGRLTLLKSVLGASPVYYMSIFKVPKGVLKTMESIRMGVALHFWDGSYMCKVIHDSGFDFSSHCKKRIGDGSCTSFWYDIWLADAPLCVQFPRLFALELDKEDCGWGLWGFKRELLRLSSFRLDVRDELSCSKQWDDFLQFLILGCPLRLPRLVDL